MNSKSNELPQSLGYLSFDVVLAWSLENKLPLGTGCGDRISQLMRWNETRTYQAEDFSPLALGIPNWTVKPCPFSYSRNSGLKEIA